jgi:A/G-specific adenine glycosylase
MLTMSSPPALPSVPLGPRGASALLEWADRERRDLPWRRTRDPWRILVSEVMLQQTQVARVAPRYEAFVERWPSAAECARSPLADVLSAWVGLGYPRRARNLHRAAEVVTAEHGGVVPADLDALLALPGVGAYTARAVLVFAFERDVGVVDTNVGRTLARWCGKSLDRGSAQRVADALVPSGDGWRWNQAMFDLGASVCSRRSPRCDDCPVRAWCRWRGDRTVADPADGSAAVSTRQAPFEGSDRQARGRLLRALADGPLDPAGVPAAMGLDADPERAERLLDGLRAEGLVSERGGVVRLGE